MRRRLHKSELSGLFDGLSKRLEGKAVQVQVAPLRLGDQIEAEWLTLLGLSYDPRNDTLIVILDGVDVTIPRPREIHIDEAGGRFAALDILDREGVQHAIQLKEPMTVPAT